LEVSFVKWEKIIAILFLLIGLMCECFFFDKCTHWEVPMRGVLEM